MARIFTASGEEMLFNGWVWDSYVVANYYQLIGGMQQYAGGADMSPYTGVGAYYVLYSNSELVKTFPDQPTGVYLSFWMRNPSGPGNQTFLYAFTEETPPGNFMGLYAASNGTIQARRDTTILATSSAVIDSDWHNIQCYLYPRNSGGAFAVKIDGTTEINYSGDTTNDREYISGIRLSSMYNAIPTIFDDIVVNDDSGSENNSWPGQVRLFPAWPRSAGNSTQWSRAGADLGANYRQAATLGDLAILQTSTSGQKDLYVIDTPDLPSGSSITGFTVQVQAEVGAGSGNIKPTIRMNSTESQSSAQALTASAAIYEHTITVDPSDSNPITETDLASTEIGMESA